MRQYILALILVVAVVLLAYANNPLSVYVPNPAPTIGLDCGSAVDNTVNCYVSSDSGPTTGYNFNQLIGYSINKNTQLKYFITPAGQDTLVYWDNSTALYKTNYGDFYGTCNFKSNKQFIECSVDLSALVKVDNSNGGANVYLAIDKVIITNKHKITAEQPNQNTLTVPVDSKVIDNTDNTKTIVQPDGSSQTISDSTIVKDTTGTLINIQPATSKSFFDRLWEAIVNFFKK